jgi:hypothetical protein
VAGVGAVVFTRERANVVLDEATARKCVESL